MTETTSTCTSCYGAKWVDLYGWIAGESRWLGSTRCIACDGRGYLIDPKLVNRDEPVMSASFDCPLCHQSLPPIAKQYEPQDISDVAV